MEAKFNEASEFVISKLLRKGKLSSLGIKYNCAKTSKKI
jgi:hypothetical protein